MCGSRAVVLGTASNMAPGWENTSRNRYWMAARLNRDSRLPARRRNKTVRYTDALPNRQQLSQMRRLHFASVCSDDGPAAVHGSDTKLCLVPFVFTKIPATMQAMQQVTHGGKMLLTIKRAARVLAIVVAAILASLTPANAVPDNPPEFKVPVEYYKLPNGLRVVLSPDHTSPIICLGVYYHIGFRIEPRDRTGFAHLFEHMMFQGSQNLGKMEFIKLVQQNGGILNGSTRFDFTNYFETLPANKLETALWAEADRMGGLAVNEDNLKNQQGVVGKEVKGNGLNHPVGRFPVLGMAEFGYHKWVQRAQFLGRLKDIEGATLPEVQAF